MMLAACAEPFEGQVHRSRYFEYHEQSDQPLCPGLLDLLDEHAEATATDLGIELEPDNPIRYYRFRDFGAYREAGVCPETAYGCALADEIFSPDRVDLHEMAHAHTFRSWGYSVNLLLEGEAVALSCPDIVTDDIDADWRDVFDFQAGDAGSVLAYAASGRFVTLLANRYGWEGVAVLHERVPPWSSATDLEEAFSELFPESIDAVWAEAMRRDAAPCVKRARCPSRGPFELGVDVQIECDGKAHRVLTVEPQSTVVIATSDRLWLTRCTDDESVALRGSGGAVHWLSVPAGEYTVAALGLAPLDLEADPFPTVRVEQNDPSPLVAATCAEARRVPLDPQTSTRILVADTQDAVWIQVDGGGRTYALDRNSFDPPYDWMALLCDGCSTPGGEPTSCVSFSGEVVVGDGAAVRMLAPESPEVVVRSVHFTPVDP